MLLNGKKKEHWAEQLYKVNMFEISQNQKYNLSTRVTLNVRKSNLTWMYFVRAMKCKRIAIVDYIAKYVQETVV